MSSQTISYYKENAVIFSEQYNAIDSLQVHSDWLEFLPKVGSKILDIGAGSGRDALWLEKEGYNVKAVEPAKEFIALFKNKHPSSGVDWIVDSLPKLNCFSSLNNEFDFILLSAVWMHLPKENRSEAFKTLSKLNKKNSLLVMSLRYGESPDKRLMYPVSRSEIELLAKQNGYQLIAIKKSSDQLKRSKVSWETVILKKD